MSGADAPSEERAFPVHSYRKYQGAPRYIRWSALNEQWARRIHDQSLEELAERGGLCPSEIVGNIKRLTFAQICAYNTAMAVNEILSLEFKP
jgi:hypothetical protein